MSSTLGVSRIFWNPRKAIILHDELEPLFADQAVSNVHMTIEMAAEISLAVIEVQCENTTGPEDFVEFLHRLLIAFFGSKLVPGGKHVAGIDAGTGAFGCIDGGEQIPKFFKGSPHR